MNKGWYWCPPHKTHAKKEQEEGEVEKTLYPGPDVLTLTREKGADVRRQENRETR